jgi:hypothetical protein
MPSTFNSIMLHPANVIPREQKERKAMSAGAALQAAGEPSPEP